MLITLLIGLLHAAPPQAPADPAAPPRIEGLRSTWVTPSTWVPALRPGRPLPPGPAMVAVRLADAAGDPAAAVDALRRHDQVERVEAKGPQLMVFLTAWTDLSTVPLTDDRTLGEVADIVLVPRPTRVPLPGSTESVHPTGPATAPVALPGSSASPFHPGGSEHAEAPGPSPQRDRPWPPPAPVDEATGWQLVIHNPYLGGPSRLSVETLGLGEADPDATIVLHDVQPGVYAVTYQTPTGAERTRSIATTRPTD